MGTCNLEKTTPSSNQIFIVWVTWLTTLLCWLRTRIIIGVLKFWWIIIFVEYCYSHAGNTCVSFRMILFCLQLHKMHFVCVHYTAMSKEEQIHVFENVHLYFKFICLHLYIVGIINEMKETTRMTKMLLDGSVKVAREWNVFGIWKCEAIDLV